MKEELQYFGLLFGKKVWIEKLDKRTERIIYDFIAGRAFQFWTGGYDIIKENKGIKKSLLKIIKSL